MVYWSEFLATDPEVPGSIPGHYKKRKRISKKTPKNIKENSTGTKHK
jgi:hypothetical protein